MKQQSLSILMIVCLCAGCATRPPASETEVIVSKIARERQSSSYCALPMMTYCDIEGTGKKNCTCVDPREVFHPW